MSSEISSDIFFSTFLISSDVDFENVLHVLSKMLKVSGCLTEAKISFVSQTFAKNAKFYAFFFFFFFVENEQCKMWEFFLLCFWLTFVANFFHFFPGIRRAGSWDKPFFVSWPKVLRIYHFLNNLYPERDNFVIKIIWHYVAWYRKQEPVDVGLKMCLLAI